MGERVFKNGEVVKFPYKIVEYLGSGGMGEVYLATNVRMNEGLEASKFSKFAVKTLLEEAAASPENVKRFVHEAQVLAQLRHPNIVHAVDYGKTASGKPYLVMEFVEGRALSQEMRRGALAPGEVADIVGQLAVALGAMHDKDIFHRDVKPQNVFLVECRSNPRRSVKLFDVGIATDYQDLGLTKAGETVGSAMYMAPEQFAPDAKVGQHTDQYALAIITYELLSGKKAFVGTYDEIKKQKKGELPSSLPNDMPNTLQVIHRGMAVDPTQRYPTVSDFHRELVDAIKNDSAGVPLVKPPEPPPEPPKLPLKPPVVEQAPVGPPSPAPEDDGGHLDQWLVDASKKDSLAQTDVWPVEPADGLPSPYVIDQAPVDPFLDAGTALDQAIFDPQSLGASTNASLVKTEPLPLDPSELDQAIFDPQSLGASTNESLVRTERLPLDHPPQRRPTFSRVVPALVNTPSTLLKRNGRQARASGAWSKQVVPPEEPERPKPSPGNLLRPARRPKWLPPAVILAAVSLAVVVTYTIARRPKQSASQAPANEPAPLVETSTGDAAPDDYSPAKLAERVPPGQPDATAPETLEKNAKPAPQVSGTTRPKPWKLPQKGPRPASTVKPAPGP